MFVLICFLAIATAVDMLLLLLLLLLLLTQLKIWQIVIDIAVAGSMIRLSFSSLFVSYVDNILFHFICEDINRQRDGRLQ